MGYSGGYWYFLTEGHGYLTDGFYTISGSTCYFNSSGTMAVGWQQIMNRWFYFAENGAQQFGWLSQGRNWYYLHPKNGAMCAEKFVVIDGVNYSFRSTGEMVTGWVKGASNWYYYGVSGAKVAGGWVCDGGVWYFLAPEDHGAMMHGNRYLIDGSYYVFRESGAMVTGWFENRGIWYYFGSNGAQRFGWLSDGGTWYFLEESRQGAMATERAILIEGNIYVFNASGAMHTGWRQEGEHWFYLDPDGKLASGWRDIAGYWYYFNPLKLGGYMVKGTVKIGTETHLFQEDGVWVRKLR